MCEDSGVENTSGWCARRERMEGSPRNNPGSWSEKTYIKGRGMCIVRCKDWKGDRAVGNARGVACNV